MVTPLQKTLLLVVAALAVLAAGGALAVLTGTMSGDQLYGLVAVMAGSTAVAGGLAISSTGTGTNIVPHVVLILGVLGLTVAMALEHVFGATEVAGVFSFVVGGGTTGAVTGAVQAAAARASIEAKRHPPAPPPGTLDPGIVP